MNNNKFRAWNKKTNNWHKTELPFYGFHLFGECTLVCPPSIDDLEHLETTQFTGYEDTDGKDCYIDDFMSNNFKTDKEVIRQVVLHEGTIMLKRVKGKSSLPKYLPLHEWHKMNMKVIGNKYENPTLLES